jgi:hypothetical protein
MAPRRLSIADRRTYTHTLQISPRPAATSKLELIALLKQVSTGLRFGFRFALGRALAGWAKLFGSNCRDACRIRFAAAISKRGPLPLPRWPPSLSARILCALRMSTEMVTEHVESLALTETLSLSRVKKRRLALSTVSFRGKVVCGVTHIRTGHSHVSDSLRLTRDHHTAN